MHPTAKLINNFKNNITEEKREQNIVILGYFNTRISIPDRTSRQKNNKETAELDNPKSEIELTDIHRTFHSTVVEYILTK